MADNCICGTGLPGMATPSDCVSLFGTGKKFHFALLVNSGNIRQRILIEDAKASGYFESRINDAEYKDRIVPTPNFDDYTWTQADPENQTLSSGSIKKLRDGRVTVTVSFPDQGATFYGQLKKAECPRIGVMIVDKSGNLIGDASEAYGIDGVLKFMPVDKGSLSVKFQAATDSTVSMVMLTFMLEDTFDLGKIGYIEADDMQDNLLEIDGNIGAQGIVVGTPTTTGAIVDLGLIYGTGNTAPAFEGVELADAEVVEISPTPGSDILTSITESTVIPGRYTLVFSSQTSGDVLELRVTKNGFDVAPVKILIP